MPRAITALREQFATDIAFPIFIFLVDISNMPIQRAGGLECCVNTLTFDGRFRFTFH